MPDVDEKLLQTNNEYRELWAKRNALIMQRDDLDREICKNWDDLMGLEVRIRKLKEVQMGKRDPLTVSLETT